MPSSGAYLAYENREFPRARTWTALLAATGAPGNSTSRTIRSCRWSRHLDLVAHDALGGRAIHCLVLYGVVARDFWHAGR